MIKKVKKIKNLGIFSNYSCDNQLKEFSRFNVIYGWNGSGKTTFSKLFSFLELGSSAKFPDLEYEIETDAGLYKNGTTYNKKVRVFNEDYVSDNIQLISSKAKPIFILGEENKSLAEQVEKDEALVKKLETQKKETEENQFKKLTEKGKEFTTVASVIGANLVGSSTRNYRKPDAERDFALLKSPRILADDKIAVQQAIIKQEQKDKIKEVNIGIELDLSDLFLDVAEICNEEVSVKVIEGLAQNTNISEWVEKGVELHTTDSAICEFCGSDMPTGRIEELLLHFNEADREIKEKIDNKIIAIEELIEQLKGFQTPGKAEFYTDLQTQFSSRLISFNQEKGRFYSELAELVGILKTKKQKTTESLTFSKVVENKFNDSLKLLNDVINSHNSKTDNFQDEKDNAVRILKEHHLSSIHSTVKELEKQILECTETLQKINNGDETDPNYPGISKVRERISANKSKISSEHKACDTLNKQLRTFLGRDELIFEVVPEEGYIIKRNGTIADNLSEGEKTAIAFIYFVVHLNDQDFDVQNGLIIIDDPISSMDSNSIFQAFSFLKNAVKDAKQVFLLTHNFAFLKLLINWLDHFPVARNANGGKGYFMVNNSIQSSRRVAFISELDKLLEKHHSEYHYLFQRIYKFESDGSIASVYDIPNIARKVLDTFLMFMVPSNDKIFKKLEKIEFDENKKTAIYKFTNDMSHITGDGFDPSLVLETQKNVKYLLEMIDSAFPEHYKILVEQIT